MLTVKQAIQYMKEYNCPVMYGDGHYVYDVNLIDGKYHIEQSYVNTHQDLACKNTETLTEEQFQEWGKDKKFEEFMLH